MAYYECNGYSKADLDKAYNNGYIAGKAEPKSVTVRLRLYRPQGAHTGDAYLYYGSNLLLTMNVGNGIAEPSDDSRYATFNAI